MLNVLLVEDDAEVGAFLQQGLREAGHTVSWTRSAGESWDLARERRFDAAIFDRMLPDGDGIELVRRLRGRGDRTPVLILSALGEVPHRVEGLRAGSDDYLTKPFAISELLARLEALVRRTQPSSGSGEETIIEIGNLTLDLLAREARRGDRPIPLQNREFRILEYLMRNAGRVVTRTMLLEQVWDYRFDPQTNVIDVHISRLRQKIDRGAAEPLIHTVRGAGYMIRGGER